ncbi:MAG: hypothetical protein J7K23_02720 [Thermoproteales archaeon]|nr:hypothetical protein [Thermoproteales archaeon]
MIILKRFEDNLVRISYSLKDYDIVNFLYLLILNRVQDFNHSSSRKEPEDHPIDQVEKGIHVSGKKRKSTKIKFLN